MKPCDVCKKARSIFKYGKLRYCRSCLTLGIDNLFYQKKVLEVLREADLKVLETLPESFKREVGDKIEAEIKLLKASEKNVGLTND